MMTPSEKSHNPPASRHAPSLREVSIILTLLLAAGITGYFVTRASGIRYIFAHLAALAVVGLLADLAAWIGSRKGYPFKKIFCYCLLIPVVLGILVMVPIWLSGGQGCGGPVTLAAALLGILIMLLMKRKPSSPLNPES